MNNPLKYLFLFLSLLLPACNEIAIRSTPPKKPIFSHSAQADYAQKYFWQTLHQSQYENIPKAEKLLLAAYLQNPNDPKLAAHLGFLHIWRIAERQRQTTLDPDVTNEIILSTKYFSDAVTLDPSDARYLGFLGVSLLAEGQIFHDQRQQVRGYFTLKKAIGMWPQFNYFTAGYPMSSLPSNSKRFKQGLAWQWKNLDICAGEKVNRENPDFSKYLYRETPIGREKACWNSWIAPYNFEGFFLNMGDMLVKAGDWQTAIKIYRNAQLAKNYSSWPYRNILETRIQNAQQNVFVFNQDNDISKTRIMFNSSFACSACHQFSALSNFKTKPK